MGLQLRGPTAAGAPLSPHRPPHRAALVSRQFVDMTRIRIEGLLAAFPKLVGSGKQHTYVETENVRYLYQPIEVRGAGIGGGWQARRPLPPPRDRRLRPSRQTSFRVTSGLLG